MIYESIRHVQLSFIIQEVFGKSFSFDHYCKERKKKKKPQALEGGLEPPTLWLTATRSNQLSYSSYLVAFTIILF